MTAFNIPQTLRGFDAPPPPQARGLIGIEEEQLEGAANDPFSPAAGSAVLADRQSRPTFENPEPRPMPIGIGAASEFFGRAAFAHAIIENEALALFRDLLADAARGIDVGQETHLREVKEALDAERSPGNKLFR